jgi:hypothetical protein
MVEPSVNVAVTVSWAEVTKPLAGVPLAGAALIVTVLGVTAMLATDGGCLTVRTTEAERPLAEAVIVTVPSPIRLVGTETRPELETVAKLSLDDFQVMPEVSVLPSDIVLVAESWSEPPAKMVLVEGGAIVTPVTVLRIVIVMVTVPEIEVFLAVAVKVTVYVPGVTPARTSTWLKAETVATFGWLLFQVTSELNTSLPSDSFSFGMSWAADGLPSGPTLIESLLVVTVTPVTVAGGGVGVAGVDVIAMVAVSETEEFRAVAVIVTVSDVEPAGTVTKPEALTAAREELLLNHVTLEFVVASDIVTIAES